MPRRASKRLNPFWIAAILLVVTGAVITGRVLLNQIEDPYRTIPPLDIATYLDNSDALRGNVYKTEARIDSSLAWSPERGRLLSVEVDAPSDTALLPVLVPTELSNVNIQKGQTFLMQIEVGEDGILLARGLRKS